MNLYVSDIGVNLSGTDIIENIELKVMNGQFVGIIGPNGCGKSTLLKTIYKVIKPKCGTILLDEMDLLAANPKVIAQKSAVVGQFNEISFDFTVWDMVAMGRSPHKKLLETDNDIDAGIIRAALEKVNLEKYSDRSYLSLSGGEKQRVVLARAIAQQPQLLILDEPTNHLDVKYQIQVLSTVKSLSISTLAALHDLELAARYCDYLYAMKAGHVVAHGKPEAILIKDTIQKIYDVKCEIYRNPVNGCLAVTYLS